MPETMSPPTLSVYFDFDQFHLTRSVQQDIRTFCENLPLTDIDKIEVLGYTDPVGTSKYNKRLSKKRADEVADFMTKVGLDAIEFQSHGEGIWPDMIAEEKEMRQVKILVYLTDH